MSAERIEIEIEVHCAASDASLSREPALIARITSHVSDIVEDLGLPIIARPVVRKIEPGAGPGAARRVLIDSAPCRQAIRIGPMPDGADEDLADYVSRVIHTDRLSLLTPRVMRLVAAEHGFDVAALLPQMTRRCIGLPRVVEVGARARKVAPRSARHALEIGLARGLPAHAVIEASPRLFAALNAPGVQPTVGEMFGMMRDGLFYELGMKFPEFRLMYGEGLRETEFRVRVGDLRGPIRRTLAADEFLVSATSASLAGIADARPAENPANGIPSAIVTGNEAATRCESFGHTTWDFAGFLVLTLAQTLRDHAACYFTLADSRRTLSLVSQAFPLSVVDLLERFSPVYVVDVLRLLIEEQCSIRDLRSVMEAMLEINGRIPAPPTDAVLIAPPAARLAFAQTHSPDVDAEDCANYVRRTLKRYLTYKHAASGALKAISTSRGFEQRFGNAIALDDTSHASLVSSVASSLSEVPDLADVVILTSSSLRRRLRRMLEIELPHIPVLSRDEVDEAARVDIVATVTA